MSECPLHQQYQLDQVCITQNCPQRGSICRMCLRDHKNHQTKTLNDFLAGQLRLISQIDHNDVKEEEILQTKIINQLNELKRDLVNSVSRVQIEAQHSFQQELAIRNSVINDQDRQLELIKQLQNQNFSTTQTKDKVLELLHRSQAKFPPSGLYRYQEVLEKISTSGKEVLRVILSLLDTQPKPKELISQTLTKPPPKLTLISPVSSQHQKIPSPLPQNSNPSSSRSQLIFTQQFEQTSQIRSKNYPTPSLTPERQRLKIFTTPQRVEPFSQIGLQSSSSRKNVQQRDLSPVGTYTSIKSDYQKSSAKNYFTQIV